MKPILPACIAAVVFLSACGGAPISNPYGAMPNVPVSSNSGRTPTPVADPLIVLAQGQSNMVKDDYAIATQFTSRLRADAMPGQDVYLVKAGISGTPSRAWVEGGEGAALTDRQYTHDVGADYMLVHQGEADRSDPQGWVDTWGVVIQQQRNRGIIDKDTHILFGEVAHNGETDAVNGYMGQVADRYGATIVSSAGLETVSDGRHFTTGALKTFGNRFYDAATK